MRERLGPAFRRSDVDISGSTRDGVEIICATTSLIVRVRTGQ
jgi:hypothetical protein